MPNKGKLLQRCRQNKKNVRLRDAIALAEAYGFTARTGGKHPNVLKRAGFPHPLNFQERGGFVPSYQIVQLLNAIDALVASGFEEHDE